MVVAVRVGMVVVVAVAVRVGMIVVVVVAVRVGMVVIVGVNMIVEGCDRSHRARRINRGPILVRMCPSPRLLGISEHGTQRPAKTAGGRHCVVIFGLHPSGTDLDADGDTIDVNLIELAR